LFEFCPFRSRETMSIPQSAFTGPYLCIPVPFPPGPFPPWCVGSHLSSPPQCASEVPPQACSAPRERRKLINKKFKRSFENDLEQSMPQPVQPDLPARCTESEPAQGIKQPRRGPKGVRIINAKIVKASLATTPKMGRVMSRALLLSYRTLGEGRAVGITAEVRRRRTGEPNDELASHARALFNKLCPEKFDAILKKVLDLGIGNEEQLGIVIDVLVRQVWDQPFYGDSFADLVFVLSKFYARSCPGDGAPLDFRCMLLNACEQRFEEILSSVTHPVDTAGAETQSRQKKGILATIRFFGMLHVRQLLSFKIVRLIAQRMLDQAQPGPKAAEVILESILALITSVGHTVDQDPQGVRMVGEALASCEVLAPLALCPGRLRFLIQDVRELRGAAWVMTLHNGRPTTLSQIQTNGVQARTLCGSMPEHLPSLLASAEGLLT